MPIVLFSFFVLMMALSFLTSFISIRFDIAHLSKEWLGVVGSMYTMGMTLSNFGFSRFVARYGFIRTYVGISSVIGLSMLLLGFVFNPWVWSVLRFIIGYGLGAIFIIIESWVMLVSQKNAKGEALAHYCLILYLGYAIAPYLFRCIRGDYTTAYPLMLMALLVFISIAIIVFTRLKEPIIEIHDTTLIFGDCLQKAPVYFIQCFASGVMNTIIYVFFPKVMFHHPYIHFTYLLSIVILGGALFQYPVGILSDRYKHFNVLLSLNIMMAILLAMSLIFFNTYWILPLLFLLGGCLLGIYPLTITATCRLIKNDFSVVQTLLLVYGLGCILGPFICIWMFMPFFREMDAVWVCLFAVNFVTMILSFFLRRHPTNPATA